MIVQLADNQPIVNLQLADNQPIVPQSDNNPHPKGFPGRTPRQITVLKAPLSKTQLLPT